MRELSTTEIRDVNGGRNFFTVISGVVWGAVIGAVMGIPLGPAGIVAGMGTGAFNGAAVGIIKEGGEGLVEILHEH